MPFPHVSLCALCGKKRFSVASSFLRGQLSLPLAQISEDQELTSPRFFHSVYSVYLPLPVRDRLRRRRRPTFPIRALP